MKNKTGSVEVTTMVMSDKSVRVFSTPAGSTYPIGMYVVPNVKAKRMVVTNGSDSTQFVEYDMGGWVLEVGQIEEDNRIYVFARKGRIYNSICYIEVDEYGKVHE
jgi:hypothetical protein